MKEKAVAELDPVLTKTGFTKAVEMIYEDMGTNMAKNLGVEQYGGNVQIAGTKKVGYAYWCTVNKDMYICKVQNSLNYIDAAYFEAFSNNALLGKLNNLHVERFVVFRAQPTIPTGNLLAGTQTNGVLKLDLSVIPTNYTIVGYTCICDTSEVDNFTYGSVAGYGFDTFRFTRLSAAKGFVVYAYALRIK